MYIHTSIYRYIYRYIGTLQHGKEGKACSLDHQPSAKAQAKSTRALALKLGIARFRLRRYLKTKGFLKIGVPLGGSHNKDYRILGSILESSYLERMPTNSVLQVLGVRSIFLQLGILNALRPGHVSALMIRRLYSPAQRYRG